MNNIKIFEKEEFGKVRVTEFNGEPLFCLADLCKAVELTNPSSVKTRLDKEDMQLIDLHALNNDIEIVGNSITTFINETGFYEVLLFSSSEKVKPFRRWVTKEVLPSIRKTGMYTLPQDYLSALKALVKAEEEKQQLALENKVMQPKAEYFDALVDRNLLTNFRDTAKELGIEEKKFIAWLIEKRFVYRDAKKQLKPYADYTNDLFEIKEYKAINSLHVDNQTLITPRGRETFRLLLQKVA